MNIIDRLISNLIRLSGILNKSPIATNKARLSYHAIAKILGKLTSKDSVETVTLNNGTKFSFRLSDPYWSKLLSKYFVYEPEVEFALRYLSNEDFALIDCGANFGYWSVKTPNDYVTCKEVHTIEASDFTLSFLKKNIAMNDANIHLYENAISDVSNQIVKFSVSETKHAGASIVESKSDLKTIDVKTISIEDIVNNVSPTIENVVIKLDIEGFEGKVLTSSPPKIDRNFVFIYEDHANDDTSEATKAALDSGLRVYFVSDTGEIKIIEGIEELEPIKIDKRRGYNFLAVKTGSNFDQALSLLVK